MTGASSQKSVVVHTSALQKEPGKEVVQHSEECADQVPEPAAAGDVSIESKPEQVLAEELPNKQEPAVKDGLAGEDGGRERSPSPASFLWSELSRLEYALHGTRGKEKKHVLKQIARLQRQLGGFGVDGSQQRWSG